MAAPNFIKIPNKGSGQPIAADRQYRKTVREITHYKCYNGCISFFICLSPEWIGRDFHSSKGTFFAFSDGYTWVSLPEYRFRLGLGHFYGQHKFGNSSG